jgi:flavin-binding protein dodecin
MPQAKGGSLRDRPVAKHGHSGRTILWRETTKENRSEPKVIEVVGKLPKERFAKATENAVAKAGKTVPGMKWAWVAEMKLDGKKKKN